MRDLGWRAHAPVYRLARQVVEPFLHIAIAHVAAPEACHQLEDQADDVVCLQHPPQLYAIGLWYEDFAPVSDEEPPSLNISVPGSSLPVETQAWFRL